MKKYIKIATWVFKKKGRKVCRVLNNLYNLKETSRQWWTKFSNFILKKKFNQSKANYNLLLVYIGDISVIEMMEA